MGLIECLHVIYLGFEGVALLGVFDGMEVLQQRRSEIIEDGAMTQLGVRELFGGFAAAVTHL